MTAYDDCVYCSTCGWHHDGCWCRGGVLRDPDEVVCYRPDPEFGSIGFGRAERPCAPQVGAATRSPAGPGAATAPVGT